MLVSDNKKIQDRARLAKTFLRMETYLYYHLNNVTIGQVRRAMIHKDFAILANAPGDSYNRYRKYLVWGADIYRRLTLIKNRKPVPRFNLITNLSSE